MAKIKKINDKMNIVSIKSGVAEAVVKLLSPLIIFILLRGRKARKTRSILKFLKEKRLMFELENTKR